MRYLRSVGLGPRLVTLRGAAARQEDSAEHKSGQAPPPQPLSPHGPAAVLAISLHGIIEILVAKFRLKTVYALAQPFLRNNGFVPLERNLFLQLGVPAQSLPKPSR